MSTIADIHRANLRAECECNGIELKACELRKGKLYICVRCEDAQKKGKQGYPHVIEVEVPIKTVNISAIIRRIKQLTGRLKFDKKECVPTPVEWFDSQVHRERKSACLMPDNVCRVTGEKCTQILPGSK